MAEITGCARVTGNVVSIPMSTIGESSTSIQIEPKEKQMTARVGQKAPDFSAPSYYRGGFTPVKLADFAGKWVFICFYPGDFTFV